MKDEFDAKSEITINAPVSKVWNALVNPDLIKQYMFGSEVVSDWKEGSSIIWKGVWQGKPYEDKGVITKMIPEKTLQYTHFSPLSGAADVPKNYHTMTYDLSNNGGQTHIVLSQDNNANKDEQAHSQKMWDSMLLELQKVISSS